MYMYIQKGVLPFMQTKENYPLSFFACFFLAYSRFLSSQITHGYLSKILNYTSMVRLCHAFTHLIVIKNFSYPTAVEAINTFSSG